uniref:G-patch domain-containing protein n=1 Tax=Parascaris univalens TaxID=6257 RepID=A0A915CIU4_PARUN
ELEESSASGSVIIMREHIKCELKYFAYRPSTQVKMMIDPDEEEDMERFEIDDRDIEFAINPGARRGLTKSQQLYGIWGDREESEDEEDLHAGFGSSASRKRSKNYSAPVAFVSGGVKHGNRIEGEHKDTDKEEEPIRIERRSRPTRPQMGANVFAGFRSSAVHSTVDPDKFADWAKYSKSDVIMKMMRNMGYVPGQGLGANKQGIVEPVQAVLRPGRAAIGAYGKEAKEWAADAQRRTETTEESSFDVAGKGNWKKSGTKKGVAYQYKTFDEVIAEGGALKKRLE